MRKLSLLVVLLLGLIAVACAQMEPDPSSMAGMIRRQLACDSNPKAGQLLIKLHDQKKISGPYVVMDSVSYFTLREPIRLWSFEPLAVFGFEQGYPEFFTRSPGTSPPEMIGIIVADSVPAAEAKLKELGLENLRVQEHPFDLNGEVNEASSKLTEVMCWERH